MYTISFFALFFLGLVFGSFLNVVAFRYGKTPRINGSSANIRIRDLIGGRSRCMRCGTQLRWYELLPLISFMFLRGRCRTCKEKISWQYPIVEFLSGLLFVFVPLRLHEYTNLARIYEWFDFDYLFVAFWVLVFLFLLLLSIIDIRHYIIPNAINVVLLFLGAVAVFLKAFLPPFQQFFVGSYSILFSLFPELVEGIHYGVGSPSINSGTIFLLLNHIFGFLIGGGFFSAVYALTRGKGMGFGDVKLGFALGFLLGWPDILFAMIFAFIVGGAWGVVALLLRKKGFKSRLPFGPFFAIGTVTVVFFGHQILNWYFGLFSV